jgi:putative transcriptional regulator
MGRLLPITNRVRELREQHGPMTQAELGELIGVTRQTVAAIEKRQYSPSLESAFRISRVFGLPMDEVFSWEE